MTSKVKPVEETPAVPEMTVPEAPVIQKEPFSIRIGAPAWEAFDMAAVHIRNGYVFAEAPVEIMPNMWAWFTLIKGNPSDRATRQAKESSELAAYQEEMAYRKDVADAAKAMLEAQRQEELAKRVAEIKAQQAKLIKAAEQEAQAAIDALQ